MNQKSFREEKAFWLFPLFLSYELQAKLARDSAGFGAAPNKRDFSGFGGGRNVENSQVYRHRLPFSASRNCAVIEPGFLRNATRSCHISNDKINLNEGGIEHAIF